MKAKDNKQKVPFSEDSSVFLLKIDLSDEIKNHFLTSVEVLSLLL